MRSLDQWLVDYAESHQNSVNQKIHSLCVPVITFSVLGLLWSIPIPEIFSQIPFLNWASLFAASCFLFYTRLSFMAVLMMLAQIVPMLILCHYLVAKSFDLLTISIVLFVVSWIFQFIGHKIEGKKPSFFEDLQFFLVAPLWVSKKLLGLPK
jgi:uncharacterized membrane protein YGL010W